MHVQMAPSAGPEGKQVKSIRVGLTAEAWRDFEELRWILRAKSEGDLGFRLVTEAIERYRALLEEARKTVPSPERTTPPSLPAPRPSGPQPEERPRGRRVNSS